MQAVASDAVTLWLSEFIVMAVHWRSVGGGVAPIQAHTQPNDRNRLARRQAMRRMSWTATQRAVIARMASFIDEFARVQHRGKA
ncbi:hypothetical protein DBB29_07025 [Pandoraea cepalis]|uniref:Transposase n=1 Tax=Pandoraea cepalis TaxID=2508294 RepID=A0AAW7MJY3_9BURK|nr:hypothetical protein [Pandoraea cepalis]MDN4577867.1 hypothetical protein [Pandoraea cepalis]